MPCKGCGIGLLNDEIEGGICWVCFKALQCRCRRICRTLAEKITARMRGEG